MSIFGLIEYADASPEVRTINKTTSWLRAKPTDEQFLEGNRARSGFAQAELGRHQAIMGPGALDPLTKEMIYVAVSVTNQCPYCIASHTAAAKNKGMTDAQFKELMSVVGMANETNRLVAGYQVEVDERYKPQTGK